MKRSKGYLLINTFFVLSVSTGRHLVGNPNNISFSIKSKKEIKNYNRSTKINKTMYILPQTPLPSDKNTCLNFLNKFILFIFVKSPNKS